MAAVALGSVVRAATPEGDPPSGSPESTEPAYGSYDWPVRGPIIRPFESPAHPYAAGHRGIDIGAPFGTPVQAAAPGLVAFAGSVGGSLFVSVDHPDGIRTTYSWLSSIAVRRGDRVERGDILGATGSGHPGSPRTHLHFGARIGDLYIDPMLLLGGGSLVGLIRLAPLDAEEEA
ncbi:MAG: M23 family metallopeptidase [Actinomycetota bacterium]